MPSPSSRIVIRFYLFIFIHIPHSPPLLYSLPPSNRQKTRRKVSGLSTLFTNHSKIFSYPMAFRPMDNKRHLNYTLPIFSHLPPSPLTHFLLFITPPSRFISPPQKLSQILSQALTIPLFLIYWKGWKRPWNQAFSAGSR